MIRFCLGLDMMKGAVEQHFCRVRSTFISEKNLIDWIIAWLECMPSFLPFLK